jgi:hypothetical protein
MPSTPPADCTDVALQHILYRRCTATYIVQTLHCNIYCTDVALQHILYRRCTATSLRIPPIFHPNNPQITQHQNTIA